MIAYSNSCHEMGFFHESGDDDLQPHGFCATFATKPCCSEPQCLVTLCYWTGSKRFALIIVVALQVKENHDMAWSDQIGRRAIPTSADIGEKVLLCMHRPSSG